MDIEALLHNSIERLSDDLKPHPEHRYKLELEDGVQIHIAGDIEDLAWKLTASFPGLTKHPPHALYRFFLGSNALLFRNQSCKFTWCDKENCILLCKYLTIECDNEEWLKTEFARFKEVATQWNDILSAVASQYK